MDELTLIVLAAGIGSRYGGLKQIEPVGPHGELIIDYSVYDALQAGFSRVVFVIKEEMQPAFRAKVGRSIEAWCDTSYVLQRLEDVPPGIEIPPDRKKPWGTAHATLICRHLVTTPFAVINADDFYGRSAFQSLAETLRCAQDREENYDYYMVGYRLADTLTEHGSVARGICTADDDGYLVEIQERTRIEKFGPNARYTEDGENWTTIPGDTVVSMNMWGFTPSLFSELEVRFSQFLRANHANLSKAEFFLPVVVGALVREGRATVKVLAARDRWFGVTYQQDRLLVRKAIGELLRRGTYPKDLYAEVPLFESGALIPEEEFE